MVLNQREPIKFLALIHLLTRGRYIFRLIATLQELLANKFKDMMENKQDFNFAVKQAYYLYAIQSISTSELPGPPPLATAIVVRTGALAPNRPLSTSFMPA